MDKRMQRDREVAAIEQKVVGKEVGNAIKKKDIYRK